MRPSAIGFLFRQLAERGLRVRGGHMAMGKKIPGDANVIYWPGCRSWYDADGVYREEPTGQPVPVGWWVFEHKIGEEEDTVKRTVKGVRQLVDIVVDIYGPDWRDAAGTLVEVLDDPANKWVFEMGVTGELRNNNPGGFMAGIDRREWLECEVCREAICTFKRFGPATASKKCDMTPHCTGKIRRLPLRFEVACLKTVPKRRPKAEKPVVDEPPGDASTNAPDPPRPATPGVATVTIEEFLGNDLDDVDRELPRTSTTTRTAM